MTRQVTLFTSGSTGTPKKVVHDRSTFFRTAQFLWQHTQLTKNDLILNIFPTHTIAHWIFCAVHAQVSKADMICPIFRPKEFWNMVCLLYTSPSPRDLSTSRMPSSA